MTNKEYTVALEKVMAYANEKAPLATTNTSIGAKVTLSDWGIEMQGKSKRKRVGIVIGWLQWMNFPNDGLVTVKWEGIGKPQDMHCSQVKLIK